MKIIDKEYVVRLLQPRLTVVVSSSSPSGDALMTAAWLSPLSYIPPIVGVAISRERYTYKIIKESKFFAINILDFKYLDNVVKAGTLSGFSVRDKFRACNLTPARGKAIPIKVVKEAIGVLECKVSSIQEVGDHDLFIGNVIIAYVADDFTTHWVLKYFNPILYVSEGHFMTINKDTLKKFEID